MCVCVWLTMLEQKNRKNIKMRFNVLHLLFIFMHYKIKMCRVAAPPAHNGIEMIARRYSQVSIFKISNKSEIMYKKFTPNTDTYTTLLEFSFEKFKKKLWKSANSLFFST